VSCVRKCASAGGGGGGVDVMRRRRPTVSFCRIAGANQTNETSVSISLALRNTRSAWTRKIKPTIDEFHEGLAPRASGFFRFSPRDFAGVCPAGGAHTPRGRAHFRGVVERNDFVLTSRIRGGSRVVSRPTGSAGACPNPGTHPRRSFRAAHLARRNSRGSSDPANRADLGHERGIALVCGRRRRSKLHPPHPRVPGRVRRLRRASTASKGAPLRGDTARSSLLASKGADPPSRAFGARVSPFPTDVPSRRALTSAPFPGRRRESV